MKTKRILSVVAVILTAMLMFACSSKSGNYSPDYAEPPQDASPSAPEIGVSDTSLLGVDTTDRKIIYSYSCNIYTDDLDGSLKKITDSLAGFTDAYVESSTKNSNDYSKRATYRLRIKSGDLNKFIESIKTAGEFTDESLSADDITKSYLDLQAVKAAKEAEMAQLLTLYNKATKVSELTELSQRMAYVQAELNSINSSIKNYDSLVALSTVNISIYQSAPPQKETFGTKLVSVIKGAGKAVAVFFEYLLYIVIYVLPFAAVGGAVLFAVLYIRKKIRAKKAVTPVDNSTPEKIDKEN